MHMYELIQAQTYFSDLPMQGDSIAISVNDPKLRSSVVTAYEAALKLNEYGIRGLEHISDSKKFYGMHFAVQTRDSQHIVRLLDKRMRLHEAGTLTITKDELEQVLRVLYAYIEINPLEDPDKSRIVEEAMNMGIEEYAESLDEKLKSILLAGAAKSL